LLALLLLLEDQNPLTMGTVMQFIPFEKGVVQLGRQVHVAAHAGTIPRHGQSLTTTLIP